MRDTKTTHSACPNCLSVHDAASSFHDAIPSPGNISICINCGFLMAFNNDLSLRALSDDEMVSIKNNDAVRQEIEMIHAAIQTVTGNILIPLWSKGN